MRASQDSNETPVTGPPVPTGPEPDSTEDLLVEEVSIDGMCGVY